MKILNTMDRALISSIENMCHRIQRYIGRTNYWIAGKVATLAALIIVILIFSSYRGGHSLFVSKGTLGAIIIITVVPNLLYYALVGWKTDEGEAFDRLQDGLSNPQKSDFLGRLLRTICLIWLGAACILSVALIVHRFLSTSMLMSAEEILVQISQFALSTLFVAHSFLVACDPLPPCLGSLQEHFQSWIRSRIPLES